MGQRQQDQGFTLVELLIATVLVGILAAVAVVGLSGVVSSGNKSACSTTLGAAQAAATTYYANTGAYPATTGTGSIGFDALANAAPAVWSPPSNVNHAGDVMNDKNNSWSVTMTGGGGITPNGYTKTGTNNKPCT